tara:strand:- start:12 stop:455 length:444 start_codon:yes stop_codon:yes gene_type:complete
MDEIKINIPKPLIQEKRSISIFGSKSTIDFTIDKMSKAIELEIMKNRKPVGFIKLRPIYMIYTLINTLHVGNHPLVLSSYGSTKPILPCGCDIYVILRLVSHETDVQKGHCTFCCPLLYVFGISHGIYHRTPCLYAMVGGHSDRTAP